MPPLAITCRYVVVHKPEMHDISQRRQRRTEPRPKITHENISKDWTYNRKVAQFCDEIAIKIAGVTSLLRKPAFRWDTERYKLATAYIQQYFVRSSNSAEFSPTFRLGRNLLMSAGKALASWLQFEDETFLAFQPSRCYSATAS